MSTGADAAVCLREQQRSSRQPRQQTTVKHRNGTSGIDEMNNWMWIGMGLVILVGIGWPTASFVVGRRRRRKEAEDEKVRLRGSSGWFCAEYLPQEKRHMVTSAQTEEVEIVRTAHLTRHIFSVFHNTLLMSHIDIGSSSRCCAHVIACVICMVLSLS